MRSPKALSRVGRLSVAMSVLARASGVTSVSAPSTETTAHSAATTRGFARLWFSQRSTTQETVYRHESCGLLVDDDRVSTDHTERTTAIQPAIGLLARGRIVIFLRSAGLKPGCCWIMVVIGIDGMPKRAIHAANIVFWRPVGIALVFPVQ